MWLLLILFIAPFVLIAHLLGASWGLAVIIGLSAWVPILIVAVIVAYLLDKRDARRRKKLRAATRARRL
jgi:CHASE2 domain-containing sensor protein